MWNTVMVLSEGSNNVKVYDGEDKPNVVFKGKFGVKNIPISAMAKAFSEIKYDIEMPVIVAKTPPIQVVKISTVKAKVVYQVISEEFKTIIKHRSKRDLEDGIDKVIDYEFKAPKCYWMLIFDDKGLVFTRIYHFEEYAGEGTTLWQFMLGNANPDVCWGDYASKMKTAKPRDIQGIISQFWSSVFNDDLIGMEPKPTFVHGKLKMEDVKSRASAIRLDDIVQSLIRNL